MKGGNDGLGEQGWSRRGRMVQWSRDGAGDRGFCRGARMVLWSRDGVGEQGWSCGARMVQGSKNDAVVKALNWLSPMWPGFNSRHQCHNDMLVVFFVARGFSAGTPAFPFFKH